MSPLQELSSQRLKLLSTKQTPTPTVQFSFNINKMLKPHLTKLKLARMMPMLSTPEQQLHRPPLIMQ